MQRIGIYSGSFDPIHKGHIGFALEAINVCDLDKVVFLPECSPRGKPQVSPLEARLTQIKAMTTVYRNVEVKMLTTRRFTFTTTMPELRELYPQARFTLLMGSDIAKSSVHNWNDADRLFAECDVAIGLRGEDMQEEMKEILSDFAKSHNTTISYCTTSYPLESSSVLRADLTAFADT